MENSCVALFVDRQRAESNHFLALNGTLSSVSGAPVYDSVHDDVKKKVINLRHRLQIRFQFKPTEHCVHSSLIWKEDHRVLTLSHQATLKKERTVPWGEVLGVPRVRFIYARDGNLWP